MSEKTLERCPCCGDASDYDTDEEIDGWFAFCMNRSCGCRSGIFPTKPMARNAWNTRASSPAHETVTTEPVAWRYQRKEWDALLWRYQTEALVNDDFETPGDWLIEPLYAIPAPPQPGREWPEGDRVGIDPDLAKLLTDSAVYVQAIRSNVIEECLKAARDGFEDAMKNYVLIGPSGMAMQMINSIKALTGEPK